MFKGSYVALITPFKDNGQIDEKKFEELIEFQIKNKTNGIVPCGCTGEAATLKHEEQKGLIKLCCDIVKRRVPVVAGTGSNNTEEALLLTQSAKKAGCDGALLITPYYNKPTDEGQYLHYKRIADETKIPIMLYNVPSRTGVCMKPETIARLSKVSNIVAVKEASGSMDQISKIISLCDIDILSGDDSMTIPMMSIGACGVVSVAANIIPEKISKMTNDALNGDFKSAGSMHNDVFELCKSLFIETNPIPVKTALMLMGMLNGVMRLPLCGMMKKSETELKSVLKEYKLI